MSRSLCSRAKIVREERRLHILISDRTPEPISPIDCLILELFAHHSSPKDVFLHAKAIMRQPRSEEDDRIPSYFHTNNEALVIVGQRVLCCDRNMTDEAYRIANLISKSSYVQGLPSADVLSAQLLSLSIKDVTEISRSNPLAGGLLSDNRGRSRDNPLTLSEFEGVVRRLCSIGCLTILVGEVQMADLNRQQPLCHDYGYSRGTPIDRYYLSKFVSSYRRIISGVTLEVGGSAYSKALYDCKDVARFVTLDRFPESNADIVGDIHDEECCAEEMADTILIFNVLEHCERPWQIVNNLYKWLRPGGRVLCIVPMVQRIHYAPQDYWRITPDGLQSLFAAFTSIQVTSYGSFITAIASLAGLAAEELSQGDLDRNDRLYPVVSGVVAEKKKEL